MGVYAGRPVPSWTCPGASGDRFVIPPTGGGLPVLVFSADAKREVTGSTLVNEIPDSHNFWNVLRAALAGGTGVERLEHDVDDSLGGQHVPTTDRSCLRW